MKSLIAFCLASILSTNAFAWGDKEQGVVIGIVGTIIGGELIRNNQHRNDHNHYGHQCGHHSHGGYSAPSNSGVVSAYERGLRQRLENEQRRYSIDRHLREAQDRAEYYAFRCGINPEEC